MNASVHPWIYIESSAIWSTLERASTKENRNFLSFFALAHSNIEEIALDSVIRSTFTTFEWRIR